MDLGSILQALASLIFVVALIGLCSVAYRKYVMDKNLLHGRERRLKIEENLYLDAKRKLVLVRKDDQEILILVGGTTETVISTTPASFVAKPSRQKTAKNNDKFNA